MFLYINRANWSNPQHSYLLNRLKQFDQPWKMVIQGPFVPHSFQRTSDGGNGNHSVSLPNILLKIKWIKCFHLHI